MAVSISLGAAAYAGTWQKYDETNFIAAQKSGNPVILDFKADWCSTCKKLEKATNILFKENDYKNFIGFRVNYDNSKDLKKKYKVIKQSTLIVFKGNKEVSRSIGVTDLPALRRLLNQGI